MISFPVPGLQRSFRGHDHEVAQISERADAAHVVETKALNGEVWVGIASAVVAARDGIRAELHQTCRRAGAGEELAVKASEIGIKPL